MKVNKGDFIELVYVGRIKETGEIFDLNDEEVAKKENIHNPKDSYAPITVCIGQGDVIQGLDEDIEGKDIGIEYTVSIAPEKAYGKKDGKLFKLVPATLFRKEDIRPMPGLQITADGMVGVVKSVSGGRILVDFNHPLAGKDITYSYKIKRKIEDDIEKVKSYLKLFLGIENAKTEVKDSIATIDLEVPESIKKAITKNLKERILTLKEVKFIKTEQKVEEKKE